MNQSTAPLRGHLQYLHLSSPDPARLAAFYAEIFGMRVHTCEQSWICRGPSRCLVFSAGEANGWHGAGYAAADSAVLQGLAARARASLIASDAIDAELFQPGAIAFRDPDGNRIAYGLPAPSSSLGIQAPPARLQHVVVGSTDVDRMVRFYTDVVGMLKSDDVLDDEGGVRTCFMRSDHEHHSFAVFRTPKNRLDHHCYELPDWNGIRDWGDRLADARVQVKWGPGRHGPGNNLFLFFHDPDGNWVELSAELEIVSADRPVGIWPHEERTLNSWGRGYLRS